MHVFYGLGMMCVMPIIKHEDGLICCRVSFLATSNTCLLGYRSSMITKVHEYQKLNGKIIIVSKVLKGVPRKCQK